MNELAHCGWEPQLLLLELGPVSGGNLNGGMAVVRMGIVGHRGRSEVGINTEK